MEDGLDLRGFDWSLLGDLAAPVDAGMPPEVLGDQDPDPDLVSSTDLTGGVCPHCGRSGPPDPMWLMLRTVREVLAEALDDGETQDEG